MMNDDVFTVRGNCIHLTMSIASIFLSSGIASGVIALDCPFWHGCFGNVLLLLCGAAQIFGSLGYWVDSAR